MFGKSEIKYLNKIASLQSELKELKGVNERLNRKIRDMEIEEKHAVKAMQLEYEDKLLKVEKELQTKYHNRMEKGLSENFDKFKETLVSVTEEGTAQTKFIKDISLKMIDRMKNDNVTMITNNPDSKEKE